MSINSPAAIDEGIDRFCPSCGYNLRAIASSNCPECGLLLEGLSHSTIPWANRHKIGRAKAFLRTAMLATFRPRRLAMAVAQPVDFSAAKRFRLTAVTIAFAPLIIIFVSAVVLIRGARFGVGPDGIMGIYLQPQTKPYWEIILLWFAGATLPPVLPLGVFITFLMWAGIGGIWYRLAPLDDERFSRAIAVGAYASGPLTWLGIAGVALAAAIAAGQMNHVGSFRSFELIETFGTICLAVTVFAFIAMWTNSVRLLAGTTHCGAARTALAAIAFPVFWIASIIVGLGLVPCLVGWIWILLEGFR